MGNRLLRIVMGACLLVGMHAGALGQPCPAKPARQVVAFAPGADTGMVASPNRTRQPEAVPTFAAAGYPAVEGSTWYGVHATAGTPRQLVRPIKTVLDKWRRVATASGNHVG